MNKDLIAIFEYLEREKGIKRDIIISAIEDSLINAAKKSIQGASNVSVNINHKTGKIDVFSEKEIVDEVEVPSQEISLEEAREYDPECQIGQFIDIVVTPKDFGRIAAQKAKQIIVQKLRGAERDVIFEEYRHRIGDLVSGTVKRFVKGANLVIDLGKVEGFMPMREYPKTEKFHLGEKVLALLLDVRDTENGGAEVLLSRSSPLFVKELMRQEVPEITDGIIEVMNIVREAGYRTKLVVKSQDHKIDPVGACVGMRGGRVKNVVRELNNEKIDIIPYSADPVELLQNALSPIEIRKISINEEEKVLSIVVDDDDYAIVIGKKGWNARLNSQLIGYDLEVQRMTEYHLAMAEYAESDNDPSLDMPLETLEGVNKLVVDQLQSAGFMTPRDILKSTKDQVAKVSGISPELVEQIMEKIRKQRNERVG